MKKMNTCEKCGGLMAILYHFGMVCPKCDMDFLREQNKEMQHDRD